MIMDCDGVEPHGGTPVQVYFYSLEIYADNDKAFNQKKLLYEMVLGPYLFSGTIHACHPLQLIGRVFRAMENQCPDIK